MANILVLCPFTGSDFGGGLAVVNEQLTRALAEQGHHVKLLTFTMSSKMASHSGHGIGEKDLLTIADHQIMAAPDPNTDALRKRMCDLLNRVEKDCAEQITRHLHELSSHWMPDIILGHSRFSGPAAIQARNTHFPKARVGYFLHSFPLVEGVLLTGFEAFGESMDGARSKEKLKEELQHIGDADVVLAVGPLLRWGAQLMLDQLDGHKARVHELISGLPAAATTAHQQLTPATPLSEKEVTKLLQEVAEIEAVLPKGWERMKADQLSVQHRELLARRQAALTRIADNDTAHWERPGPVRLVLSGRASAAVKGYQEILDALVLLKEDDNPELKQMPDVAVRVLGMATTLYDDSIATRESTQQFTSELLGPYREHLSILVSYFASKTEADRAYRFADAVLTAAYIEHFGLVPFEAIGSGRPVLVSEFSGAGQFLQSRYPELSQGFVVNDITPGSRLTPGLLTETSPDQFANRPAAWAEAIFHLVTNIKQLTDQAQKLRDTLQKDFRSEHFAVSVVNAFDGKWNGRSTWQAPQGQVEEVPGPEQERLRDTRLAVSY